MAVIAVIALALTARQAFENSVSRFYAFAVYVNALEHYHDTLSAAPADLDALERTYTAYRKARGSMPPDPPYSRPVFRSLAGLPAGEYLILVEPPSPRWIDSPNRMLIYVHTDGGGARHELVNSWNVAARVAQDDVRRGAGSP